MQELKLGILIIGSLLWDKKKSRIDWRENHLSLSGCIDVRLPIRYGRKSETRNNTYTMVFSRLCLLKSHGLGVGKAIPCKNKINSFDDLYNEALYLWTTECNKTEKLNSISSYWGSVSLLINPRLSNKSVIREKWSEKVRMESNYFTLDHSNGEDPILNSGLLNIPWPQTKQGSSLNFDLLLATATKPTLEGNPKRYPRVKKIVAAWNKDKEGYVKYFLNNIKHGIKTYQDELIKRDLNQ